MQRAHFLQRSAGAMLAVAIPPFASRAFADDSISYKLTSTPFTFSPSTGQSYPSYAYNGFLPGPILRARVGQRVRIAYTNKTGHDSTIHWHGMILPNAMDGVQNVTQKPVPPNGTFEYAFAANPSGTRWYHDHYDRQLINGLFGVFIVEDPADEPADAEFVIVLHDVPSMKSYDAAMRGVSNAPMTEPMDSREMTSMKVGDKMGDEVGYLAHCINGASYPQTKTLTVRPGARVRLRMLNANPTETKYVRLAGHKLTVTHTDGNRLSVPIDVDVVRLGVAERIDAYVTIAKPGAFLLQEISSEPTAYQQSVVLATTGMEHAPPQASSMMLGDAVVGTYEILAGINTKPQTYMELRANVTQHFELGGGVYGNGAWTMNDKVYPHIPPVIVHHGDLVRITYHNTTDMDHPMHLHGHVFKITKIDGKRLARPLLKDTSLVRANGGTMTWEFHADSPAGRWLLHCHNSVHMMSGMMTEVDYKA